MALPIDMSTVSAADKYPEGRFRVRVLSAEVRPKDAEINDQCEVVGQVTEKGTQKYCGLSVGFRYIEHPSNYTVDENGKDLSMVGRTRFQFFSMHPKMIKHVKRMFVAAGIEGSDEQELVGQEIDIVSEDQVDNREPDGPKESKVTRTMVAMG